MIRQPGAPALTPAQRAWVEAQVAAAPPVTSAQAARIAARMTPRTTSPNQETAA